MQVSMKDNIVTIELDGVEHKVSRSQARMISNKLLAVLEEKEDYLSLEKGDDIYYVDKTEGVVEKGIIFSVQIKNNAVDAFSVEFPESGDFDEFNGWALGDCFFIDRGRAEDALKRP